MVMALKQLFSVFTINNFKPYYWIEYKYTKTYFRLSSAVRIIKITKRIWFVAKRCAKRVIIETTLKNSCKCNRFRFHILTYVRLF